MPPVAGVTLNEARIKGLITIYRRAIGRIENGILGASSFEKARRAALLKNIQRVLVGLKRDVDHWADTELKAYYLKGIKEAERGLELTGAPTKDLPPFTLIDQAAVSAITDEVKLGFAESIRGLSRSTQRILVEAQKLEVNAILAEGLITGATSKKIAGEVKQLLMDQGLTGLVDKSGRKWSFESYTNMLVRTKAVEARNAGLGNRMAQYGFDLVQVSDHNSSHPACAEWEGEILSYTGQTPGYRTYDDALSSGLFHPNCKHAINPIDPKLAEETDAYDNPYNYIDEPGGKFEGGETSTEELPNISISKAERDFLNRKGVKFQSEALLPDSQGKDIYGLWNPLTRTIYLDSGASKHAVNHEVAHAIDRLFTGGNSMSESLAKNALQRETDAIVFRRVMNMGFNADEATALLEGAAAASGADVISITKADRYYFEQLDEVFADGYSQFKRNPLEFKKYAPELYKIYKGLF